MLISSITRKLILYGLILNYMVFFGWNRKSRQTYECYCFNYNNHSFGCAMSRWLYKWRISDIVLYLTLTEFICLYRNWLAISNKIHFWGKNWKGSLSPMDESKRYLLHNSEHRVYVKSANVATNLLSKSYKSCIIRTAINNSALLSLGFVFVVVLQ